MKRLFVSYAREDRPRVEPLVALLHGAGFEVFWDQAMPAGVEWSEFLDAQLSSAHCLLVLWTAASVASRWVRIEADEALQQGKLLPVLIEAVRPPLAFRQIQCFDLIGWQGDPDDTRLQRLVEQVLARTADPVGPAPTPEPGPTPPPAPTPAPHPAQHGSAG